MAVETALQRRINALADTFRLLPFSYTIKGTIPTAYGNVTSNMTINASAPFLVTGVSGSVWCTRGNLNIMNNPYRDQFEIVIGDNNTGQNFMNAGIEIADYVVGTQNVEFQGYLWNRQTQIRMTAQHTNFVQFPVPDTTTFADATIKSKYGFIEIDNAQYTNATAGAIWTTQTSTSNNAPYAPFQVSLTFTGLNLYSKGNVDPSTLFQA